VTGSCHCGAVTLNVERKPEYLNDCNCSFCRKLGVLWGYFETDEVTVVGETAVYTRQDRDQPAVRAHFCATCGCTTHWSPMPHIAQERMGANMRLFDPADLIGVEHRFPNGRDWDGLSDYSYARPHKTFGADQLGPA
jgi:hypothetical protein